MQPAALGPPAVQPAAAGGIPNTAGSWEGQPLQAFAREAQRSAWGVGSGPALLAAGCEYLLACIGRRDQLLARPCRSVLLVPAAWPAVCNVEARQRGWVCWAR